MRRWWCKSEGRKGTILVQSGDAAYRRTESTSSAACDTASEWISRNSLISAASADKSNLDFRDKRTDAGRPLECRWNHGIVPACAEDVAEDVAEVCVESGGRIGRSGDGRRRPSVAMRLMYATSPRQFHPKCYLRSFLLLVLILRTFRDSISLSI